MKEKEGRPAFKQVLAGRKGEIGLGRARGTVNPDNHAAWRKEKDGVLKMTLKRAFIQALATPKKGKKKERYARISCKRRRGLERARGESRNR